MPAKRIWITGAAALLIGASFAQRASAHDEPVKGTLIGAGVGAAIAGPPGAAVGAVLGATIGAHVAHESDHGGHAHPRAHRHHGRAPVVHRYREEARYVQPARYAYVANGNGHSHAHAAAYSRCEPEARKRVVQKVSATASKPKMKKVCRLVPVRHAATASRITYPAS